MPSSSVSISEACAMIYFKFRRDTEVKPFPLRLQLHEHSHTHTQKKTKNTPQFYPSSYCLAAWSIECCATSDAYTSKKLLLMCALTFYGVYQCRLLCVVIAAEVSYIRFHHHHQGERGDFCTGMSKKPFDIMWVSGFLWMEGFGDLEAFHKLNLRDWQSFTEARIMDEVIHTKTHARSVHLSPHRWVGTHEEQQCRWPDAHTCTNTWICTHRHFFLFVLQYAHTHAHTHTLLILTIPLHPCA